MLKKKSKFKSMLCLLLAVLLITLCCPITASAFEDPFAVSIGSMYVYPISIVEYTEGYYASDYDFVENGINLILKQTSHMKINGKRVMII